MFLSKSEHFTKLISSVISGALYACSFYLLTQALRSLPLVIAYASWGGIGIILTTVIGVVVFRQKPDAASIAGIALIIAGVVIINGFPNRPALVRRMVLEQIEKFEGKIDELIEADPVPYDRFTRAYIGVAFNRQELIWLGTAWMVMAATITADKDMREIWNRWLDYRLDRHQDTDSDMALEVVRLAADGAWY